MGRVREIVTITRRHGDALAGSEMPLEAVEIDLGPDREPRDEAALLLTVAAEVEHALMVQYLYAAYSIRSDQADHALRGRVRGIAERLIQIAREEMGHLMTVQNLLHLIGAPPHFERGHSPFESELYPFRFKLEPLSGKSLAKYVTAESPMFDPDNPTAQSGDVSDNRSHDVMAIADRAKTANDGEPIRHVGVIYERLIELFEDPEGGVRDEDFETEAIGMQANERDWGFHPGPLRDPSRRVRVDSFESKRPHVSRESAVAALNHIANQGEGRGDDINSHFERFLELYDEVETLEREQIDFVWPVATNPDVQTEKGGPRPTETELRNSERVAFEMRGAVTHPRSAA